MPPEKAVDYFTGLVPTLGTDPQRFGEIMNRHAFTLAVATDTALLGKVQDLLRDRLATGVGISTAPQEINRILDDVGVGPANPQYGEMVFRTNMMDSYNQGFQEELAASTSGSFPVWQYHAILDDRVRDEHRAHDGNYYPASVPFTTVRDSNGSNPFNCRCTFSPVYVDDWEELQRQGATVATDY